MDLSENNKEHEVNKLNEFVGDESQQNESKNLCVVTVELPIKVSPQDVIANKMENENVSQMIAQGTLLPLTTVQSESMVAILDVAGIGDEVNMSTLERKRKRAKSEEKTASSRGVHAETLLLSKQDVEDAVLTLTQGSEDNIRSRKDNYQSQYPRSGRRHYDWNTHHFFPDVHDVGYQITKRRSHESIYSQYIEQEWLREGEDETQLKETSIQIEQTENQENVFPEMAPIRSTSSSDGDESPKVWRKNPLLVRKKKKSDRRLSQEIQYQEGEDEQPGSEHVNEYDSPRLRVKEGSPRNKPRRQGSNGMNRTQRRNSDLIQEKVEKFQELQRRRKALESTSEESLAQPKKHGRKIGYRHSDLGSEVKDTYIYDLRHRSHSQEDIRYESHSQKDGQVHIELSPQQTQMQHATRDYAPSKVIKKSQYDFHSFQTPNVEGVHQSDFYSPEKDKRTQKVDYRNISSSFENIYDAVDLSMYSPNMDTNVGQLVDWNMAEAHRRYQLYKQKQLEERGLPSEIQIDIDARRLPAKLTVKPDHSRVSNPRATENIKPEKHQSLQLKIKRLENPDETQSGTPPSPVWYVPKPDEQYTVTTPESNEKKTLDAKALIEEEKKKFEDYKREYVRRLSERDSTSGTSGDEKGREIESKHRVIPPDDYEYILRKIHHQRQDAYYAESTSQYGVQEQPRSAAEQLKLSILAKKQQQALAQKAAVLPAKSYLDSLRLPDISHERSSSQLSTDSSRELEQYFVVGKQKHPNAAHSIPYTGNKCNDLNRQQPDQYQSHAEEQERKAPFNYAQQENVSTSEGNKEPIPISSERNISDEDEKWLSVQDKKRLFEKYAPQQSDLVRSTNDKYLPSKPPVAKREDFVPPEPDQWNYNVSYSPDMQSDSLRYQDPQPPQPWSDHKQERIVKPAQPDRLTPLSDRTLEPNDQRSSPSMHGSTSSTPSKERYGLMLRLTPQGAIATMSPQDHSSSNASVNDKTSPPVDREKQRDNCNYASPRPMSSPTMQDPRGYQPEPSQQRYESNGRYPEQRYESPRDWKSQEDFQKIKDGQQYRERHAPYYPGHQLGRDHPGPSKTPPPPPNVYNTNRGPGTQAEWAAYQQYPPDRYYGQPSHELMNYPRNVVQPDTQQPVPSRDGFRGSPHPVYNRSEPLQSQDRDRPQQKSWSSRINEVESMRPSSHLQGQPHYNKPETRSFAVVAVNEKNNNQSHTHRDQYRNYEDGRDQHMDYNREAINRSMASSQYEEHVKRSQEKYKAQKHATVDSERPIYPPGVYKTDYVDPNFIRQRKSSSDSNHSVQNIPNVSRPYVKSSPTPKDPVDTRSYGLQIHLEKAEPKKSEICVKLNRSREDISTDKPSQSIEKIKNRLLSETADSQQNASYTKDELENVWDRSDRKVSAIQNEVFFEKGENIPRYPSHSTSSAAAYGQESDERILHYASYKDGQARKRSNIFDVLTDLERTYEKLDLDNENLLDGAERREYVSHVLSASQRGSNGQQYQYIPSPGNDEPNIKRLSITNLKKLEDMQKEHDSNPSLEYAKKWIEEDKSRARTSSLGDPEYEVDTQVIPRPPCSESDISNCKLSSLPRKVKDDMAFRRQNNQRPTSNTNCTQELPASTTMSYLAKSPTVSPSQSMDSLNRRTGRFSDPVRDDVMYRHMQRAKSPAVTPDRELAALKSPTSTDYLNERTTEPLRGRMRIRPEKEADKYHDDLAYRKLRKDVAPVVAELPEAYYRMKRSDGTPRHRSNSLDRGVSNERGRDTKRSNQPLERSQSLGPSPRIPIVRRSSLSKGIAQMVDHFNQPVSHTQSAPDLTEQNIFGDSYNEQGDLVSDDPRYAKYAQKPKKSQTPRTVKMRHEMKTKMRQLKHSADSGYMEQSESDASHSSSGPENRSPPEGNFDSDVRLSDTSSDREIPKHEQTFKSECITKVKGDAKVNAGDFSDIQFIDDGDEANGNNNNNASKQNLPHHTFVFKLPDEQTSNIKTRYQPQFTPPKRLIREEDTPNSVTKTPEEARAPDFLKDIPCAAMEFQAKSKTLQEEYKQQSRESLKTSPSSLVTQSGNQLSCDTPQQSQQQPGFSNQHLRTTQPFIKQTRSDDTARRIAESQAPVRAVNNQSQVQMREAVKPTPPTRVSSLAHDPSYQRQQEHVEIRSPHHNMLSRESANRSSWHGSSGANPRVEIVQAATIETRSSRDMDRHIRLANRRSWHDQELSDDDKRVKVEFAFKAPDVTQAQFRQNTVSQASPMTHMASNVHQIHTREASAREQTTYSPLCSVYSPPQPTYDAPVMKSKSQSPMPKAAAVIQPRSDISTTEKAKFELPVIRSRPLKEGVGLQTSSSVTVKPTYTIEPIVRKAGNVRLSDMQSPDIRATPATFSTSPVTTATRAEEKVVPKSPKSQHIQLRDITTVLTDPTGKKPPSQVRTTQIQVVTSSVLNDEKETRTAIDEQPRKEQIPKKPPVKRPEPKPAERSTVPEVTPVTEATGTVSDSKSVPVVKISRDGAVSSTVIKQVSNTQNRREIKVTERSITARPIRANMPMVRLPYKGVYLPPSSMLSPTSPVSPAERVKLSPAERGFILSPPPRRAGADHFELSDGEMTDATDITLDGLVRSNMYRPSSPETLDFSDFADNVSETESEVSQQDRSIRRLPPMPSGKKVITSMSSTRCQQVREVTSGASSTKTVSTSQSSSRSQEILRSANPTEADDKQNLSFKDLVKSFEAKVNPFLRSQDTQKSLSTEELQDSGCQPGSHKPRMDLRNISGSDPNLFNGEPQSPSWRRL